MYQKLKKIVKKEGVVNFLKRKYYTKVKPIKEKNLKTITFKGKKIKIWVDPKNGYVDKCIYAFGGYEKEILEEVVKYFKKNAVVFDIGANIGQHSIIFSLFSKEVYAFEPNLEIFNQFSDSVKENRIKNIHLENYGVGVVDEEKELYINPENVGNSSVLPNEKFEHFTIKIKNLKSYEETLTHVDFVKIDVEGFELDVILGNKSFFEKFKPTIWIEYNPVLYQNSEFSVAQLDDLIKSNNYKIYSFRKDKNLENLSLHLVEQDDILLIRN